MGCSGYGSGIGEAPLDGQQYARQSGDWKTINFPSTFILKGQLTVAQINALDPATLETGWTYQATDAGTVTTGDTNLPVDAGDFVLWLEELNRFEQFILNVDLVWGAIEGDINNQTDLMNELNNKAPLVHTHTESHITDLDKYTVAEVDAKDTATLSSANSYTDAGLLTKPDYAPSDGYEYLMRNGAWERRIEGYGGVIQTGTAPVGTIGSTPVVIQTNQGSLPNPVNVVQDVLNDGLVIQQVGIWEFKMYISLTFDDSNQGRNLEVELYNATDGNTLITATVSVGRNQEGATFSAHAIFQLDELSTGDLLNVRVYSPSDTFSSVAVDNFGMTAVMIDGNL